MPKSESSIKLQCVHKITASILNAENLDITLESVQYHYGRHVALYSISLTLRPGVTGILGPNGAGKSTLLRLIAGLTLADSGHINFDGRQIRNHGDASHLRSKVGYLPQNPGWNSRSTVLEFVTYFAQARMGRSVRTKDAVIRSLAEVELAGKAHMQLRQLSGGQRRRAFLAQALTHNPSILVLDEPTAGLDPVQRIRLRELVANIASERIVVWATHIVDDLVNLADEIAVLEDAQVKWIGDPQQLVNIGIESRVGGSDSYSDAERGFLTVLARPGESSDSGQQ